MRGHHAARYLVLLLALSLFLPSSPHGAIITTVAGGGDDDLPALGAAFPSLDELTFLPSGNLLVISAQRVYRITPNGRLFVVAGNGVAGYSGDGGPATEAMLNYPHGVAADAAGNVFMADSHNNRIRRVDAATGLISTIAGTGQPGYSGDGGPATSATLGNPIGVAVDAAGNVCFSADNRVRHVDAGTGIVTTVAGTGVLGYTGDGGPAIAATFYVTTDVELDASGNLFILDAGNRVVRRVDAATGIVTTMAGNGTQQQSGGDGQPATSVGLFNPNDIGLDTQGRLLISDERRVRSVDLVSGIISTVAGTGGTGPPGDGGPAVDAVLSYPRGVASDADGNVFIADFIRVRRVDASTRIIDSIAGLQTRRSDPDGLPAGRLDLDPSAAVVTPSGDLLFAERVGSDEFIRRVSALDGRVETIAGGGSETSEDVPANTARLWLVRDLEVDPAGNVYYVEGGYYVEPNPQDNGGTYGPNRVRRIDAATGAVRTVAGLGHAGSGPDGVPATSSGLSLPVDLALDAAGNLFIAEGADFSNDIHGGNRVRKVNASDGLISTYAGTGLTFPSGGDGGPATQAALVGPRAVAADPRTGDLYIAESWRVRRVSAANGIITTVAGTDQFPISDRGDEGVGTAFPLVPISLLMDDTGTLLIGEGYFSSQVQGSIGRVWALDVAGDWISAFAGNGLPGLGGDGGPALQARIGNPARLAFDPEGRLVFMDTVARRIRQVGLGGLANRPPMADAGGDVSRGCVAGETAVALDAGSSTDPDGDLARFEWYLDFGLASETLLGTGASIAPTLPPGSYDVTLRVEDSRGLSDLEDVHVEISEDDLQPPTLTVALSPQMLWPPSHRLVDVEAAVEASDDCASPAIVLESIVSSEPDDAPGSGDGRTTGDIVDAACGTDDRMFRLRAERDSHGGGRTYLVTYRAEDGSGKVTRMTAGVVVPHDVGGRSDPIWLSLEETPGGTRVSWEPVTGALSYDVVRGALGDVRVATHEIRLGSLSCLAGSTTSVSTAGDEDTALPSPGGAFFYLVGYDDGSPSGFGTADAPLDREGTGGC